MCVCVVAQLCPTLCNPMNYSPPGSSVHGSLQAWILEWVAMPSSRGSSQPINWTWVSRLLHWHVAWGKKNYEKPQPTLRDSYESIHSPHKHYEPCLMPGAVGTAQYGAAVQGMNNRPSRSPPLPSFPCLLFINSLFSPMENRHTIKCII